MKLPECAGHLVGDRGYSSGFEFFCVKVGAVYGGDFVGDRHYSELYIRGGVIVMFGAVKITLCQAVKELAGET
jgi:hypothetical protein